MKFIQTHQNQLILISLQKMINIVTSTHSPNPNPIWQP